MTRNSDYTALASRITHRRPVSHERDDAVCNRRMPMGLSLIAAVFPALFVCNIAMGQVGTATPAPTIGETSPLGIATSSASSPTGIPLGATELASPGVSPVPSGVTGTNTFPSTSSGCACRKLDSDILMMKSAQDWAAKNVPGAIDGARYRCILVQ